MDKRKLAETIKGAQETVMLSGVQGHLMNVVLIGVLVFGAIMRTERNDVLNALSDKNS